eukprot:6193067-Pleurochrysis_carterae.AAC.2
MAVKHNIKHAPPPWTLEPTLSIFYNIHFVPGNSILFPGARLPERPAISLSCFAELAHLETSDI